jgi:hypothetical protein
MLANFLGVLPILTPPLCAKAFIMCSKSNPIVKITFKRQQLLTIQMGLAHKAKAICHSSLKADS